MFVYSVAIVRGDLWRDLKMYGHAIVPLCLPSAMQSLLFSNKMAFNLLTVY